MIFFIIILAILSGISNTIGRILNSNLAINIGIIEGTFINYLVGFIFTVIFLFLETKSIHTILNNLPCIPFWAYLGGIIGIGVVTICNFITPKISNFYLTILVFLGQLAMGIIIDYFMGNLKLTGKIIGGILIFLGLTYNLKIDNK